MEPVLILLNKSDYMTPDDAAHIRAHFDMDALDKNPDLVVHIVMGPDIRQPSRTFINAFMEPSFRAGRSFGYKFPKEWIAGDKDVRAGNYMIVADAGYSERQRKAAFDFHHVADNLYDGFEQEKQYWHLIHDDLRSSDPKHVAFALKELRRDEKLADFFEARDEGEIHEKIRMRALPPTTITLNEREYITAQQGQDMRRQYGLDALDMNGNAQVRFVVGPAVKGCSKTFIHALLRPSFQRGNTFAYPMRDEDGNDVISPGNFELTKAEKPTRGWFEFEHDVISLFLNYRAGIWVVGTPEEIQRRPRLRYPRRINKGVHFAEIVQHAQKPHIVFGAVNHLRAHQEAEDLFEAGLGHPEQVDVRSNEGDAMVKYGLKPG